ncbi:MAG TPA: ornithine cyclodeaminase family protein [Blastocatellia bacterium]|nr:ornithine cyclodeaminase family protein [Blastocatellia bacterium]
MKLHFVDHATVARLLPMSVCMDLMTDALVALGRDHGLNPLRTIMWLPERVGALGTMPGYLADRGELAVKVITVFPGNDRARFDSHQGFVLVFDAHDGHPLAVVDASAITAIRTAAVSGVATRLLARGDAADLALLGAGVQAATHLEAMRVARPIGRVRVWSCSIDSARDFAARYSVEAVESPEAAVRGADIVCTVTSSREPVLEGAWLAPGTHVNVVGSSASFAREVDTAAVVRSRVYVDRMESALAEAGDLLIPMAEGAIDASHIVGEIGEVAEGTAPGRRSVDEITMFKSLGLAVEDVAAACHVARQAVETGAGATVEM